MLNRLFLNSFQIRPAVVLTCEQKMSFLNENGKNKDFSTFWKNIKNSVI